MKSIDMRLLFRVVALAAAFSLPAFADASPIAISGLSAPRAVAVAVAPILKIQASRSYGGSGIQMRPPAAFGMAPRGGPAPRVGPGPGYGVPPRYGPGPRYGVPPRYGPGSRYGVLPPRRYVPSYHGARYRYYRPGYRWYGGWWYAFPWWLGAAPGYYYPYRYGYGGPYGYGGQCEYWSQQCIRNWGYGNANYRGCLRYHGCL